MGKGEGKFDGKLGLSVGFESSRELGWFEDFGSFGKFGDRDFG